MRRFALILGLAIALPALAADAGRADLDGDGRDDCWTVEIDGGSGFSFATLTIERPCGGPSLVVETGGSFAEFVGETVLPAGVSATLQRNIASILFRTAEVRPENDIDDTFRLLLGRPPRWTRGTPRTPPNQVFFRPQRIVSYYGDQHGPPRKVASCRGLDVFATKHGIALYDPKRDRSKWIYVANGVVEKLRWASIETVTCTGRALDVGLRGEQRIALRID